MLISIIFTTYNSPIWLEKVLWGFENQKDNHFEIIIADDGSGEPTKSVIERFQTRGKLSIKHIWHPDDGFQKCRILNKAIVAAAGSYIIMTDGDCIPRNDFVAVHRNLAEPGRFLSGGYFKLPMATSECINESHVRSGQVFDKKWLVDNGVKNSIKLMKLTKSRRRAALMNYITPTKPTWNGHNASCYKEVAIAINGFDERMRYGGQDREFGERLTNSGIIGKQIRYSTICVHLDHARGYANDKDWENNKRIRANTRDNGIKRTDFGIEQL